MAKGERMKEYICKEVQTENGGYLEIEKELIRCKDCKYNPKLSLTGCPMAGCMSRTDEWYCPVGKPKENEK